MSEIATLVCPHVFANERSVRVLIHHHDGTWQAVCGERDHLADCGDFQVVGLNHLLERQPELKTVEALETDHFAEWLDGSWAVAPFNENNG